MAKEDLISIAVPYHLQQCPTFGPKSTDLLHSKRDLMHSKRDLMHSALPLARTRPSSICAADPAPPRRCSYRRRSAAGCSCYAAAALVAASPVVVCVCACACVHVRVRACMQACLGMCVRVWCVRIYEKGTAKNCACVCVHMNHIGALSHRRKAIGLF